MNKVIKILIGVAGVGKSTYTKQNTTNKSLIVSSDELRKEMFGSLEEGNKHNQEVFQEMESRTKNFLLDKENEILFYDATNLTRKIRKHFFNTIKSFANKNKINLKVEAVLFLKPLKTILEQNSRREGFARVPDEVILKMYQSLEIPKVGLDCDSFEVITDNFTNFVPEFAYLDIPHDSPYHKESVKEHIDMCINNAKQTGDETLVKIAIFHDLGKVVCKSFIDEEKTKARFINHEKVSAMYFLAKLGNKIYTENDLIAEVIYQHMNTHFGITEKTINKHHLTELELDYMKKFAEIDNKSKIV